MRQLTCHWIWGHLRRQCFNIPVFSRYVGVKWNQFIWSSYGSHFNTAKPLIKRAPMWPQTALQTVADHQLDQDYHWGAHRLGSLLPVSFRHHHHQPGGLTQSGGLANHIQIPELIHGIFSPLLCLIPEPGFPLAHVCKCLYVMWDRV